MNNIITQDIASSTYRKPALRFVLALCMMDRYERTVMALMFCAEFEMVTKSSNNSASGEGPL